jgi:L-ascorbate metabolism protein UlaG (beta-lactamase superfamily)
MRRLVAALAALALAACSPVPVPRRTPYHPSDADLSVTRIVHGSVILGLRGTRVVIDPWFHSGLLQRQTEPLGLTPEGLPALAAVLVTRGGTGHVDERALRALAATVPEAIAPAALAPRLERLGFERVTPLGWWDTAHVGGITVTAVPARRGAPRNGYVLEADGVRAYVMSDTRPFDALVDVATRFPRPDVALLWVGGARLFGFEREMGPEDAARAAALLDARRVVPLGYGERGGLPLRWHARRPVARFTSACAAQGIDASRVVVLEPGESWHYYR